MPDITIATDEADARAAEAVKAHHAQMSGALATYAEAVLAATARFGLLAADRAREELVGWCRNELLPHAAAEEKALYPAARATTEGRLLVEAMLEEHRLITGLVRKVDEAAGEPVRAAAAASALRAVFESHLAKENDLVLPLLAATPGVSLAELLGGMHEILGEAADGEQAEGGCGGHGCTCGEEDAEGYPELDARAIPHALRHATIFGALETVRPGAGLVLLAPHDPVPLLGQIAELWPGAFDVEYLETGPDTWRLALTRRAA